MDDKKRVLIVDDDPKVHKGFRKILHPMRQKWDVEYAMSAEEALRLLDGPHFNVIVSDLQMPKMDGVELLGIVMERHPEVVRIILSGQSDRETVLGSVQSAHQCLMKPCDAETIIYTIERTCKLQDLLRNEALKELITGIKGLPSFPSLYGLIVDEMNSEDASLKKVGYIISQDVSMSAKILQLVNSAFFGLPRKIMDPQQAAVYLGIDTLKALVLSIHVFSSFKEESELYGVPLAEMWKHSMMTGRLARDIASSEFAEKKIEEEALIAGILHDIGKLILLKIPKQCDQIMEYAESNGCSLVEAEYAVLETSHAELGAYLLGLWGLPDVIVETVAFHHNPSKLMENIFIMLSKSSNKDAGKAKSGNAGINSQSLKKCLTEFSTLTAVHTSNALMIQKDCSYDTAVFPHVDMLYLRTLNMTERLPKWADGCSKVRQEI